jgi:membrane fusion protein, multidrug efflux system
MNFSKIKGKLPDKSVVMFLAVIAFAATSCRQNNNSGQPTARVLNVDGYTVIPEFFAVKISATGNLLAWEEVEIKTPVAGNVLSICFEEGQMVSKGELLLEVDNRQWEARKNGLEARLISSKSELARKQQLLEIEAVSLEEIEQSQADVDNLRAQIEELEVMIDLTHIRAPFAGQLGLRDFSPGAYLAQGAMITRLVQNDRLKVDFSIPAKYADCELMGKTVTIKSSVGDRSLTAVIYAVDPMISPLSGSLKVRARFDNKQMTFMPGDFVRIECEVEQFDNALLVPAEAVIPELNAQVVFVAENGKAKKREVETGGRTSDRVQITSGLSPGDIVLTTGLMEVSDGSTIQLRNVKQEAAK